MYAFWKDWYVSSLVAQQDWYAKSLRAQREAYAKSVVRLYEAIYGKIDSTTFLKWGFPDGMMGKTIPNIPGC